MVSLNHAFCGHEILFLPLKEELRLQIVWGQNLTPITKQRINWWIEEGSRWETSYFFSGVLSLLHGGQICCIIYIIHVIDIYYYGGVLALGSVLTSLSCLMIKRSLVWFQNLLWIPCNCVIENYCKVWTGCFYFSLSFVHHLPRSVVGGGPCFLMIIGQGRPLIMPMFLYMIHRNFLHYRR